MLFMSSDIPAFAGMTELGQIIIRRFMCRGFRHMKRGTITV
jgi:hypothetical protein